MDEQDLARALRENELLTAENERLARELRETRGQQQALRESLSWRVTAPLRRVLDLFIRARAQAGPREFTEENYRLWVREFDTLSEKDRGAVRACMAAMPRQPQFSILLTVRDADEMNLRETLQSIRRQLYREWELCIVDDASTRPHVARTLANCGDDPRVRIVRVAGADPLAMARGEFHTRVEAGDVLAETALFEIAMAGADADLIYTDEDALDERGERCRPLFKPGWSPELRRVRNYLGALTVYRRGVEAPMKVCHVPAILCHRRDAQPSATAVVQDPPGPQPKVTVIIPTRDRAELLEQCLEGLLRRTVYAALDVIVVNNNSRQAAPVARERVRVLDWPGEFNWSAMNNRAARLAAGEVLLFLNNDIDVIEEHWLTPLAAHALRDGVGAVGAKLLFPDRTVQHAGIWLGPGVFARHLLRLSKRVDPGYAGQLSETRNLSAVTGACMAVRREVFLSSGGFDESFPVSYSDIDFCLRLIEKGYRIVWTPQAELLHLESASRGSSEWRWRQEEADRDRFVERWRPQIDNDPFFNPNLDLIGEEKLALACPPRRKRSWM